LRFFRFIQLTFVHTSFLFIQDVIFSLPIFNREEKPLGTLQTLMTKIVKDRRKLLNATESPEVSCALDGYLTIPVEGKLFDDDEVCSAMNSMLFAVHDTTKSTLTFLFYCLAKYPEVQQKVYEEVAPFLNNRFDLLKSVDQIAFSYTQAVINETLRLYSPGAIIGRKLDSAITTGGFTFPKDVDVLFSPFLMGRNPKYFDDPLTFNPDRFLGLDKPPLGFIPLSTGARKCTGGKVSMKMLKIFVFKICSSFKVSLAKDYGEHLALKWEGLLQPRKQMMLTFEKRV
jgi:cytochrome P450